MTTSASQTRDKAAPDSADLVNTLELIGVGFGRTGTDSTRVALNHLGFPCYHMFEMLTNPKNRSHVGFWNAVASTPPGTQHDWGKVFARYRATVDNPAACVWRELVEAYPNAKVLLTLHPGGPSAWYDSTVATIYAPTKAWQWRLLSWTTPFGFRMNRMTRRLIWGRFLENTMDDRGAAIARYERHIEEVKASVPEERLLVFRVDEGWEPLARFLGVPVPESPFPHTNDRETLKRRLARAGRLAYVVLAVLASAVALAAFALSRL